MQQQSVVVVQSWQPLNDGGWYEYCFVVQGTCNAQEGFSVPSGVVPKSARNTSVLVHMAVPCGLPPLALLL